MNEIKQIAFECQEKFLEFGNWLDSVKPLMEFSECETERANREQKLKNGSFKNFNNLAKEMLKQDALIKKLRAALKPLIPREQVNTHLLNQVEEVGFQLIKKPDPEIMGGEK